MQISLVSNFLLWQSFLVSEILRKHQLDTFLSLRCLFVILVLAESAMELEVIEIVHLADLLEALA